jgi:hypothetical protein
MRWNVNFKKTTKFSLFKKKLFLIQNVSSSIRAQINYLKNSFTT